MIEDQGGPSVDMGWSVSENSLHTDTVTGFVAKKVLFEVPLKAAEAVD